MLQELKIKQKCEDMIVYAYTALRQYPRAEKYGLAADTKKAMYELLRLIIVCNKKYYNSNFALSNASQSLTDSRLTA